MKDIRKQKNLTPIKSRNLTKTEKIALEEALSRLPIPRKRYLKAILNTAVFWIFLLAAFCSLWFISSVIVSGLTNLDIGIGSEHASYLFPILIFTAAIFAINSTKRWLNTTIDEYSLIKKDLSAKEVHIETYQVTSAMCFKEPELGGFLYFLQLQKNHENESNQLCIQAIYDYESQNKHIDPTKLLSIKNQMTIFIAPFSGYLFEHKFEGELVKDVTQYDLTLTPIEWPEPNSWIDANWNELKSIYNP